MVLEPQVGEDPGVHARVQRLDPAVEALGEAGHVLDLRDGDARGGDPAGGRAGGHDLDARGVQPAGEVLEPGLVVHADQRATDRTLAPSVMSLTRCRPSWYWLTVKSAAVLRLSVRTTSTSSSRSTALMRSCSVASSSPGATVDGVLGDDRTGVDTGVDEVDGAAGDLDAVGERVADGVRAGERREQRGVGVDHPGTRRGTAGRGAS